jgi:hypothetical protein
MEHTQTNDNDAQLDSADVDVGRRSMMKSVTGGLLAASVMTAAGTLPGSASAATPSSAKVRVKGSMPMLPHLAKAMPESPALMDSLASEFAPIGAKLGTQKAYWVAINGWITDRLTGPAVEGKTSVDEVGQHAWAILASAYWGGMELRTNWGMPPAMDRLGIKIKAPFADQQQSLVDAMTVRVGALKSGGDECLKLLEKLMYDDSAMGVIWNIAYNAGCQVVKTEDPPLGQRRPHRTARPGAIRINARDFMRVDYEIPSPQYLKVLRSDFEKAVMAQAADYDKIVAGGEGKNNPREIWKKGVGFGNTTWGQGANDVWTSEYFDDVLYWSTVVNFGTEAAGLAAFVALLKKDGEMAKRAVMANIMYLGMASGWLMGFLDVDGKMPTVVTV